MKFRSFVSVLLAIALLLFLTAVGGACWIATNRPAVLLQNGAKAEPEAVMFVSRRSPLVLSLLMNPDRLETAQVAIAPANRRKQLRSEINQFRQSLLDSTPLNYPQDIQPWLGNEVTLAITTPDIDRNRANGQQPGYLVALAIRDPKLAQESLQKFWQRRDRAGRNPVFEQFAGVQLVHEGAVGEGAVGAANREVKQPVEQEIGLQPSLASAVVGDRFVLFANHPKVLRAALNNLQVPELSLQTREQYQQAIERLPKQQVGFGYVSLSQLGAWLTDKPESSSRSAGTYDSLLASLKPDSQNISEDGILDGILVNTVLFSAPLSAAESKQPPVQPALAAPVQALQHIPKTSILTIASTNLQQLWAQLDTELTDDDFLMAWIKQSLESLQQRWQIDLPGIDLPEDLLSWVQGDYALALLPDDQTQPNQTQPDRNPDWLFVAQKSAASTVGLERLEAIAQQQGISQSSLMLGDQKILVWTVLSTQPSVAKGNRPARLSLRAEVLGVRATVGEYEILANSLGALEQAIQASHHSSPDSSPNFSPGSLAASTDFQEAIAPLNPNHNGYFYLDGAAFREWVNQGNFPKLQSLTANPFWNHLRSIAASSSETGYQGTVFLRLKAF